MKDWLLVLPVIDPDMGEACMRSMEAIDPKRVIVVDNTHTGAFETCCPWAPGDWYRKPLTNMGVSASWNKGVRRVLAEQRDYLVICSTAIHFNDGGVGLIAALDGTADEYGLEVDNALGWHLIAFGRLVFETIGEFDEAFYPGYWNDTDFLYRMGLAGLPSPRENGRWMPRVMLDIGDRGSALALIGGLVSADMRAQGELYRRKWGGDQGAETFTTPYDGRPPRQRRAV